MEKKTRRQDFSLFEQALWPCVLMVGAKIKSADDKTKAVFWRDNWIMSTFLVGPVTALEAIPIELPGTIALVAISVGVIAYCAFIMKWRLYLAHQS